MNPVDDLTFLDPVALPSPADSSERAAVRRRGRRRRLVRLGLTSSPVVLAVAAAVAIGLAVTAGPSSQATVVPAQPTELNMTGAAPTAPGCPAGKVLQSITRDGVTYIAVAGSDLDPAGSGFDAVCARLADGTVVHQAEFGNGLEPFPDGSYLAVDQLGHVFANLAPGTIDGMLVLVPGRDKVKMLGIYAGSVDRTTPVFTLSIAQPTCDPNCAYGEVLHFRAVWDAATDTYVLRDSPLSMYLGTEPTPPSNSPSFDYRLAPETYRTAGGATLYPSRPPDGLPFLLRWHVTTGSRPFTVDVAEYVESASGEACTASGDRPGVDGHVVAPHATYSFDVSCPADLRGGRPTISVAYAPGGKVMARWIAPA